MNNLRKTKPKNAGWRVWAGVFRLPRPAGDRKRANCCLGTAASLPLDALGVDA